MKVLAIDDKDEELQKVQEVAEELGYECITSNPVKWKESLRAVMYNCAEAEKVRKKHWTKLIEEVDGVITDLMWSHSSHGEKPQGLLVVAHALSKGKPVVICTDGSDFEKGHHGEAIGFIHDGYLRGGLEDAFGWEECKNWKRAFEELTKRLSA